MPVLQLVPCNNDETISILRVLLAKAVKGVPLSLALTYRTPEEEDSLFTGAFKEHRQAAQAALHMSIRLMQASGELDRTP